MCRIYGFIGRTPVEAERLREVAAKQFKGGPDSQTFVNDPNWAIGNNRLSIVGLDGGEQPYTLGESIKIVFNGEIYNHKELRRELEAKGYSFHDSCDGSILPALYAEHGNDFVSRLDGMFAIAVIDTREGLKLTLATDPTGIKSLYYYLNRDKGNFYFSSELPSLLAYGDIPAELWLPGVDAYLTTKTVFGEQTLFANIYTLPPASLLQLRLGGEPQLTRWSSKLHSPAPAGSLEEAAEILLHSLQSEVGSLLEADVPVSTINSGGLDSSLVTALASRFKRGLHSFHISYVGDWPFDEKAYAREVAERYGTVHHDVFSDPAQFHELLPKVVHHLGQPNADPITLSSYALFEAINQAGFKVAVSGDGADEMFGGYDRFVEAVNGGSDWISSYVDALGVVNRESRLDLYSDDYRDFIRGHGLLSDQLAAELGRSQAGRLDTILAFEREYRLPSYHLRRVDHLSMAHSVEVRVPFCQPRIADLARQLTDEQRIEGHSVKRLLYRSARELLPQSILTRKKQPFTLPIDAMMRKGLPLYNTVREVLDLDTLRSQNLFNPQAVERLLQRQAEDPNGKTALALWALVIFQLWHHDFRVSAASIQSYQIQR